MLFDNLGNVKKKSFVTGKKNNESKRKLNMVNQNLTSNNKKKIHENTNQNNISKKNWVPKTIYAKKFLIKSLFDNHTVTKHLAIIGHLHHGKSSLVNCLASSVHLLNETSLFFDFTDFFFMEKQRNLSLQTSTTTLLLCEKSGKSSLFTFLDCPGHPEFFDQSLASMTLSDGVVIVIDSVEGVRLGTEMALRHAITGSFNVVIVINSIDRLIIDFKLSPKIIQKKFIQILDGLNSIVDECYHKSTELKCGNFFFFNPILNNVSFSSFLQGWSFSLDQYAELYLSSQPSISLSKKDLVLKFWNNILQKKNSFSKTNKFKVNATMFVDFILIPLYKIIYLISGESIIHIRKFIQTELGIFGIKLLELKSDHKTLFFRCMTLFFGGCRDIKLLPNYTGLLSSINTHIPFSISSIRFFVKGILGIRKNTGIGYVGKLYPVQPKNKLLALTKIIKGFFKPQNVICILTEGHRLYSEENFRFISVIKKIVLPIGRYSLDIPVAPLGSIILIDGFENFVKKSAVFFDIKNNYFKMGEFFASLIKKLNYSGLYPIMGICIEPFVVTEIKNLYNSVRKCVKFYPALSCSINKSDEIILYGMGDLYFDCVLHDIKNVFGEVDINVSNPFMVIKEGILEKKKISKFSISKSAKISIGKDRADIPNIGLILSQETSLDLSAINSFSWKSMKKALKSGLVAQKMEKIFKLPKTQANSTWCFGLDFINRISCEFLNYSLNKERDVRNQKKILIHGFNMAMSEGPRYFAPVKDLVFNLEYKSRKNYFFTKKLNMPGKNRRIFHWLILKNRPLLYSPFYFGEILFPICHYSIVLGCVKLRGSSILSIKYLRREKIFVLRLIISVNDFFLLKNDLEFINKVKISYFFYFDDWVNENRNENIFSFKFLKKNYSLDP
ncbi:U5 small nuclear ribonucleoprotein 116 kDa subunit (nucleomorph) [Chroomonas mesostigmatica CCMP1168]|uniref:U5 small nuclear ribonucleoprotein 116 kDa subunit n=1 Tax=Chroomonas mesostigmatica CCMP1168 TaxID=1195612 RepID=J7G5J0_9CRYP|nr:U5 small nuclear ribonucleoprotein 116 kDa subunit [Chroomonas mesostigmatica CCMP1168]|mmetsp:Transcript_64198/g.157939  ORF Transcript_64198/g.157939 Transcript_64198/m.157939 type:complete len:898 (+) Transcript_64198:30-2723(+)